MKKTLIALTAAATIGAGAIAAPTAANAYPAWVIPAIIAAGVGGVVVAGAATSAAIADDRYYRGTVHVQPVAPTAACYMARERTPSGWRRVRVCN